MQTKLPLTELIQSRLRQLGQTPQALGFRLGYSNAAKAAGRVYAICEGYLDNRKSRAALVRLADALSTVSYSDRTLRAARRRFP
jgi:hypothetical protein